MGVKVLSRVCVCVYVCMHECVYVWCILRIEGVVFALHALLRVVVHACVYVCMCDVSGMLTASNGRSCVSRVVVSVRMRVCVYACMCGVFGVLKVW